MYHLNLLIAHQTASVSYPGQYVVRRGRQRRRLVITQPVPIDSSDCQVSPQFLTRLVSLRCVRPRSLKTKQRELNALLAQCPKIRNYLALTQRVEHSVIGDKEHFSAFDRQP